MPRSGNRRRNGFPRTRGLWRDGGPSSPPPRGPSSADRDLDRHVGCRRHPRRKAVMTLEECAPAHTAKPALYLERYARHFEPIRRSVTSLFEMGIYEGGSMLMW